MKKLMNYPENYTDDMLHGIYMVHKNLVRQVGDNPRCYAISNPVDGKVAIITGGGTGHLPLFLGYVGEGMLDGCGVGSVFQSPSCEEIYEIAKEVEKGSGILFLYGNYTGDIMNFDMASDLLSAEGIETRSITGNDDVLSSLDSDNRRGVAGIFFMYKCAGAAASLMQSLDEVYNAALLAKNNTRTVGFAFSPCTIPEVGHPNFTLAENEMAMGMGIHGEPGIWNGPLKTSRELAQESIDAIWSDLGMADGEEVSVLINGLGATSLEELYILAGDVLDTLRTRGIKVYRTFVGEYATSMEMAGASVSVCRIVSDEMKKWIDMPISTPFFRFC